MSTPRRIAAIFDVDRTLVNLATEKRFFWYLVRRRQLPWTHALAFLLRLARHPRDRFRDKSYLQGQPAVRIDALARRCHAEVIAPRLSPRARACVRRHQAAAHAVVLLTGSLQCLVQPLAEDLQADWLLATRVAVCDGLYTGSLIGLHPRGDAKLLLIQDLARRHCFDLDRSYAYADHEQDVPLLLAVGHPVAVNPSPGLRRVAREHRWPVEYF